MLYKNAEYQGWSNEETWLVALWLDNDQTLNAASAEYAQTIKDPIQLQDALQSLVEEAKPDLGASLWGDMLTWSLGRVSWREIAEHFSSKFAESSKKDNISKKADPVKDSPSNKKDNITLPEGKETAGDKPEEAVKTTTLPADKKEVGDKADRAEEKNSLDKGKKVKDIDAVNKEAAVAPGMCARCGTSKGGTEYCEECKKQMKELDKEAHCGSCPGDPGVKVIAEACPVCGNENESLGNLGQKDHYKCRNCGIMYSHDKQASCGHCGSLNAEITNRASKADVLKK